MVKFKKTNGDDMFIEVFNELLDERNLNRKQFAKMSGIPYTTVIGWTTLGRLPDYTALVKIADFFDCSLDYLTERNGKFESDGVQVDISAVEMGILKKYRRLKADNKELVVKLVSALGE